MLKSEYRKILRDSMIYIKLNRVLDDLGMRSIGGNLSRFMKSDSYDYIVSTDTLDKIINRIQEITENIP